MQDKAVAISAEKLTGKAGDCFDGLSCLKLQRSPRTFPHIYTFLVLENLRLEGAHKDQEIKQTDPKKHMSSYMRWLSADYERKIK